VNELVTSWQDVGTSHKLLLLVSAAMENVARGLSMMTQHTIATSDAESQLIYFDDLLPLAGSPEEHVVGVYLLMEGTLSGRALLTMPLSSALCLADMLMMDPIGTAAELGELERSALAEAGNVIVSYFLNSITSLTGEDMRPSPPAVIVDMLGAIIEAVVSEAAILSDELLVLSSELTDSEGLIDAKLWVLPDVVVPQIDTRKEPQSSGVGVEQ